MPQAYSNPARANDPHALPDVEYFWMSGRDAAASGVEVPSHWTGGWFWWPCFPGCLPDGDPSGPFATEQECIDDFTDDSEDM